MGSGGSKVAGAVKRPLKNYNIERRVEKALKRNEKSKPTTAPRHSSTEHTLEQFAKDNPHLLDAQKTKNEPLLDRLKVMHIDSTGPVPEIKPKEQKPLPLDRKPVEDFEFGYMEPAKIPHGKVTIRKATELISQHAQNSREYTAQVLSDNYKLEYGLTQQVLKHFKVFKVYVPEVEKKKLELKKDLKLQPGNSVNQIEANPGGSKT